MNNNINQDDSNYPPFSCTHSPNLPEILYNLKCSIAISTYQAGKLIFISPLSNDKLMQLPRDFEKPMGIAVSGNKLGIATKQEVVILANSPSLAKTYPPKPNTYDAFYMPRATYYTGFVDIHDLHWGNKGLWGVNTSFSCVVLIDENYSFTPKWKPKFITELEHDDYCHLNGMAMKDGEPLYVSALGATNSPKAWKEKITTGGIVIDIPSNEIISKELAMPHSPRIYDNKLYMLLSATGELVCIDTNNGSYEVVLKVRGFVRGMCKYGDYLFIGKSKLRETSTTFEKLKDTAVGRESQNAGVSIVHLPTAKVVAEFLYLNSVEEIYDIQIIPDAIRPGILNTKTPEHTLGLSIPEKTFWADFPTA
ncbi:MAG: TIGR03032 family protein [Candidatus Sericytochromatia bacterium]|nr:TIGR03032 family protein [Candidatus Sericytochromatia bacterium]